MKNSFRQSMAWLHTWIGLVLGWLMLLIFVMGTASYFNDEITQWMQPETQFAALPPEKTAMVALNTLNRIAPNAASWYVNLPTARQPATTVYWQDSGKYQQQTLNPLTGEKIQARDSQGGEFFYRMHYQLYGFPSSLGSILVGIVSMFMFVALISGVITHKKIFKDFFTFRPHKGQRSWLDFHNLTAVVALPFFIMITYTGMVIFFYLYMPWGIMARYGNESNKLFDEMQNSTAIVKYDTAPRQAAMQPFQKMIQQASMIWRNGSPIGVIDVDKPNTDQAKMTFSRQPRDELNSRFGDSLTFSAATGELLPDQRNHSAIVQTGGVIYGLHQAHFASWPLRWLLFFSGLLGSAMIAAGLILWTVKRRLKDSAQAKPSISHYVIERLNITAIVGLPLAMAAYFWANRLLPVALATRSNWEVRSFFIVWLLTLIHALLRPWKQAWREQLVVVTVLFMTLPILNMITEPRSSLLHTFLQGHTILAGFDVTVFGLGLLFACAAYRVMQPAHSSKHDARRKSAKAHAELHVQQIEEQADT